MRKVALLTLPLALSGCSGMGKFFHDTFVLSGNNPDAPRGDSENLRRARGETVAETPILPEQGNIWPGAPRPLPTLRDVANPDSPFNRELGDPATYFGGASLENDHFMEGIGSGIGGTGALGGSGPQMAPGQSISAGESTEVHGGVPGDRSRVVPGLAPSVPDSAGRYMGKNPDRDIVIPNGDGTSTVIAPDGSVRVVHGVPAPGASGGAPPGAAPKVQPGK